MGVGLAIVKWPLLSAAHTMPLYQGSRCASCPPCRCWRSSGCGTRSGCCRCCCSRPPGSCCGSPWSLSRRPSPAAWMQPRPTPWSAAPWWSSSSLLPRGGTCGAATSTAPGTAGADPAFHAERAAARSPARSPPRRWQPSPPPLDLDVLHAYSRDGQRFVADTSRLEVVRCQQFTFDSGGLIGFRCGILRDLQQVPQGEARQACGVGERPLRRERGTEHVMVRLLGTELD